MSEELQAQKAYFAWLAQNNPNVLRAAIKEAKKKGAIEPFGFSAAPHPWSFGFGQSNGGEAMATAMSKPAGESEKAWYETLLDTVTETAGKILPIYYQSKAQKELIELNADRAKQGLPPIDSSQVAPTIRTQVGMDPAMLNMLVLGGVGIAIFMAMGRKRR